MTKTREVRPRVQVPLAVDLARFLDSELQAGGIITSYGHGAELGIGRFQDELAFLQARCKARRTRFQPDAYWQLRQPELSAFRAPPMGRPTPGAAPGPDYVRPWMFIHQDVVDFAQHHAAPRGPFNADRPVWHAVDAGIRLLKAVKTPGIRSAEFPFDGDALLDAYLTRAGK